MDIRVDRRDGNAKAAKKRQEEQAVVVSISFPEALIRFDLLPPKQLLPCPPWRFSPLFRRTFVDRKDGNAKAAKKRQERQEEQAVVVSISFPEALIRFDLLPPKQLPPCPPWRSWRFLAVLAFSPLN